MTGMTEAVRFLIETGTAEDLAARLGGTLRDRFAMAAITGLLASPSTSTNWRAFAEDAYKVADALLEVR